MLPSVFISHGAPTLPQEDVPARDFLAGLGKEFATVSAVLCISAHWNTEHAAVGSAEKPETIHDFYGFPQELYRIRYPARGSLQLARRVAALVENNGIRCSTDPSRGLDHGAWVPGGPGQKGPFSTRAGTSATSAWAPMPLA